MRVEQHGLEIARRHFGTRCVSRLEKRGIVVQGLHNRLKAQSLDAQVQYLVNDNGVERIWSATDVIAASYSVAPLRLS